LDTNAFTERSIVASIPVLAQQLDLTLISEREAFQYLDGSCFAGAIWTKQTKTLAHEYFQIKLIDGRYICESLYETRAA
jgi:hypothetical protein